MFKFKVSYVALAAALSSSVVYADPSSYTHRSGANVIDIEAPNAAGVSHNLYREFNVGPNGTILNNSASDVNHSTHGNIAKNNNLTNGSASVILNEVTSNKMSNLQGFIEVNGQKADVVIANPNGITCSGCSFINTNNAILTTGQVNLSDTGAIESYTVTQGKITIGDKGMNASTNYAALLADAIAINGSVTASNATLGAGNFTFDNKTGKIATLGKTATVMQMIFPEYSIDISNLGGIKANSISMVGNTLGLGVRNKGTITSNAALAMTSYGSLVNEGTINGNGLMTNMVSALSMKNTGTINSTAYATQLSSMDALTNEGTISSSQVLAISSTGNLVNTGNISGTKALSVASNGNITTRNGSNIRSDGQLAVSAVNIDNGGSIRGNITNVAFSGDRLKVTGEIQGNSTLTVQSIKDDKVNSGLIYNTGRISGNDVTITTNGNLDQEGDIIGQNSLSIKSDVIDNVYYIYGKSLNIESNYLRNRATIDGDTSNITAVNGILNEGQLSANGDMTLYTQTNADITNYNTIKANGTLTMSTRNVKNGGYRCGFFYMSTCGKGSISANKLVLNSYHNYASDMGGQQQYKYAEINTIR
ncbi:MULTISPECIES: filamentous hemagglutinin N-terminal domain-containing protein [Klebsiella]|uniref:Filamentous hemagglutinin N-terminal domain-containing protein n=1 Tax=Klebsiella quasipneumoniae subsp. quasipneumoniae TaxID=1667327 RepID=A0AAW8XQW9_9ENTR|nr:filamentous hemagglutinin N-terminal domain-containing protein [Klebsiella quasipneumoniae]ELT0942863.1 filamentous hemagglutinin N-terminal domain-containing protein [Klebsiella quasipneumoniae]MBM5555449.1 filamentous hemagglutinin N-terminal domain-containing protein [Klebsiella quasipneumoniae]MBM5561585.1 filamentous hemagglutinin N-terminal domain-containing protein [Klebsiella quasipneumoniae]MCJ4450630.1 filamentous hemagglutinin N-terminal domain-containing protein [Klebsiella quasi